MSVELEPCPFCGSTNLGPRLVGGEGAVPEVVFFISCRGCGALGPDLTPKATATELWNTRAVEVTPDPDEPESEAG